MVVLPTAVCSVAFPYPLPAEEPVPELAIPPITSSLACVVAAVAPLDGVPPTPLAIALLSNGAVVSMPEYSRIITFICAAPLGVTVTVGVVPLVIFLAYQSS